MRLGCGAVESPALGCPACRDLMDETDRVNVFLRRPVLTAVAVAVLALIVVDSVRRTVERGPRTEHWWPVLVLLAVVVYSVGAFVYVSTSAGRSKLAAGGDEFGARTRSAFALLRLAFATAPVVLAVGAGLPWRPDMGRVGSLGGHLRPTNSVGGPARSVTTRKSNHPSQINIRAAAAMMSAVSSQAIAMTSAHGR